MTTEQGAEGTTYYKAVRPDGTDFRTGTVNYLAGGVIRHPASERMVPNDASTYLSISVEPAETLIGGSWPCRLLRVQPVGGVLDDLEASRYKRACLALEVLEELPAWQALGPNGEHVAALIERAKSITADEADKLCAAGDAARAAARYAARYTARYTAGAAARAAAWYAAGYTAGAAARAAAWYAAGYTAGAAARQAAGDAARQAAGDAAWYTAGDAAGALVVRDVLPPEHYRVLTEPWARAIGKVHPDDEEVSA